MFFLDLKAVYAIMIRTAGRLKRTILSYRAAEALMIEYLLFIKVYGEITASEASALSHT